MARKVFVNLPVRNLDRSREFFSALGFDFDPRFSDENAACMVVNDDTFVMLLVEDVFQNFTSKEICDATVRTETIVAISADSRREVNDLVATAFEAGARPSIDPLEQRDMYGWGFQDPDGHQWEVLAMDVGAASD